METIKKQYILFALVASLFIAGPIKAQYTLTNEYGDASSDIYGYNNFTNMSWDINTGTNKRLTISYTTGLSECTNDYINIYEVDQYGNQYYLTTCYGNTSGQFTTSFASGRARIELYTDSYDSWEDGAYWLSGYNIYYEVNNTDYVPDNLNVAYNAYIHGDLEMGTRIQNAGSQLLVKGKLLARNVTITDSGWADFVFDESYRLPSLSSVEQEIRTNKHLKGIPSASEVKTKGVNVADMMVKLLQKVEELTLYLIQQEKEVGEIKKIYR